MYKFLYERRGAWQSIIRPTKTNDWNAKRKIQIHVLKPYIRVHSGKFSQNSVILIILLQWSKQKTYTISFSTWKTSKLYKKQLFSVSFFSIAHIFILFQNIARENPFLMIIMMMMKIIKSFLFNSRGFRSNALLESE